MLAWEFLFSSAAPIIRPNDPVLIISTRNTIQNIQFVAQEGVLLGRSPNIEALAWLEHSETFCCPLTAPSKIILFRVPLVVPSIF